MERRIAYIVGLTVLLLFVTVTTYGVWTQGSFSHGDPSLDQGCYCHNNGIAIYVNATGDGNGGVFFGPFKAGSSFHLYVSTNDAQATGVVPGLQQWESNQTDNAKFTFSPTQVTDGSAQDRSPTAGNITALYKITAPSTAGMYTLTLYAQGTEMQPILVQVTGGTTSTTSATASSASTSTTSSQSTSSSTSTTTSSHSSTTTTSTTTTLSTTSTTSTTTSSHSTSTTGSTTSTTTTTISTYQYTLSVGLNSSGYSGTQRGLISGAIIGSPTASGSVEVTITNPSGVLALAELVALQSGGSFSAHFQAGSNANLWTSGNYTVTASWATFSASSYFAYKASPGSTSTSSSASVTSSSSTASATAATVTQTVTAPPTTVTNTVTSTAPASTVVSTATATAPASTVTSTAPPATVTSIVTSTAPASTLTVTSTGTATSTATNSSSAIPDWAYGLMAVLLLIGLAIGYVVRRPAPGKV